MSSLAKWSSITYQTFCQSEFVRSLVEDEFVTTSDLFYSAIIRRGNGKKYFRNLFCSRNIFIACIGLDFDNFLCVAASMQALITIKNSYPEVPPIFSLCLNYNGTYHSDNCDDIRVSFNLFYA